jgi:hypothetical protein
VLLPYALQAAELKGQLEKKQKPGLGLGRESRALTALITAFAHLNSSFKFVGKGTALMTCLTC